MPLGRQLSALALVAAFFLVGEAARAALPPLPSGYVQETTGACIVQASAKGIGALTKELGDTCGSELREIKAQLGTHRREGMRNVLVRIVTSPEEMAAVAPLDAPPPRWAQAVAYPDENLIVLSLVHSTGHPVTDLDTVLAHELSHIELRRFMGGTKVPRWLSEGIAIIQSEYSPIPRGGDLRLLAASGELLSLQEMEKYPKHDARVSQAYAQAADFVVFLIQKEGWHGIRVLLRRLKKGDSVERSAEMAYGTSLAALEKEWVERLDDGWAWFTVLTGSGALWGAATLIFVFAYVAAVRRRKRRLDEMEEEERPLEQLIGTIEELEERKTHTLH